MNNKKAIFRAAFDRISRLHAYYLHFWFFRQTKARFFAASSATPVDRRAAGGGAESGRHACELSGLAAAAGWSHFTMINGRAIAMADGNLGF